MVPSIGESGKRIIIETIIRLMVARGWRGSGNRQSTEDFKAMKLFCMVL